MRHLFAKLREKDDSNSHILCEFSPAIGVQNLQSNTKLPTGKTFEWNHVKTYNETYDLTWCPKQQQQQQMLKNWVSNL